MEPFEIPGHEGAPLPCLLQGDATQCAIVLPGAGRAGNRLGGTPARPDLHFVRALLVERGLAVLEVWWDLDPAECESLAEWLLGNARAALGAAAERGRTPVLLVGRSIGTVALAHLRASEPDAAGLPSVWVAPLVHRDEVRASLVDGDGERFVVCGDADEVYDPEMAERLRRAGADVIVLEGADHGLDCGDAPTSARALADALERLSAFLDRIGLRSAM